MSAVLDLPTVVDWRAVMVHIRAATRWSDDRICDELSHRYGVAVDRSTVNLLRNRRRRQPKWELGAALINLYRETRG